MAVKRFSELPEKTRAELPSGYKLVGVTGSGTQGRNVNFNPWELRCPGLPAGYSLCSYVENIGNTYVDTEVPSSEKVGIQITYQFLGHPTTDGAIIIGAGSAANNTRQWINDASVGSGSGLCVGWGDSEPHGIASSNELAYGQVNFCMSHQATVNLPGAADLDLDDPSGGFSGYNLYLFSCNGNAAGSPVSPTHSKLYRCRLSIGWDIVRDFFPVVRDSDNKFGLFDAIEKKVYFPAAGNLTGERLNDVWDYSHFTGNDGAYIDDYPTPDSPNFVRTSGIEAGMEQIREALMCNYMYAKQQQIQGHITTMKNVQPNAALPNTVWYNFPSATFSSNSFAATVSACRPQFEVVLSRTAGLGTATSKYKSYYFTIGSMYQIGTGGWSQCWMGIYQPNCDYVHVQNSTAQQRFQNSTGGSAPNNMWTKRRNCTLRILCKNATSTRTRSYYSVGAVPTCPTSVYLPIQYNIDGIVGNSNNGSNKIYLPSAGTGNVGLTGINTVIYGTIGHDYGGKPSDAVYMLQYVGRYTTSTNLKFTIGIGLSFFITSDPVVEESTEAANTTYSTVCNKTDRSIVVTKIVTDGTTKTTTTYTLDNSEDSNLLRNAFWNTDGIDGTSTGLLDGVRQVGANKGSDYTQRWAIDIRPY